MFAIITGYTNAKCVATGVAKLLTITIVAIPVLLSTIAGLIELGQLLSLVPDLSRIIVLLQVMLVSVFGNDNQQISGINNSVYITTDTHCQNSDLTFFGKHE